MNLNIYPNNELNKKLTLNPFYHILEKEFKPLNIKDLNQSIPQLDVNISWDFSKNVKRYTDTELNAIPLKKIELKNVDRELKKLLKELKIELQKELKLFIPEKDYKNFSHGIKLRLKSLKNDLTDSGFLFQQLFYAKNINSAEKNVNIFLNYSMTDRAILGYLEELLRFKSSGNLEANEEKEINNCIESVKNSLKIALMNSVCIYNKSNKNKMKQTHFISTYLEAKAKDLKVGDALAIPCGYLKGSPYSFFNKGVGHATVCHIKRLNASNYEITVINTGEGNDKTYNVFSAKSTELFEKNKFFQNLTQCINISKSSKESAIDQFYACFKDFTPIKKEFFENQVIDNCTQFSIKAYIKFFLKENESLWNKFDSHFYQSVSQKCENFLFSTKDKKLTKKFIYRHPFIKPKNLLQFIFVWLICLLKGRLISYKNKQYGFKLSKRDYLTIFLDSKANF